MLIRIVLLLTLLLLITPVHVALHLQLHQGLTLALTVRCWGVGPTYHASVRHTADGLRITTGDGKQRPLAPSSSGRHILHRAAATLMQSKSALRYLMRHVHLLRLTGQLNPGGDAARACLISASARPLLQLLQRRYPGVRLRMDPIFSGPSQAALHGILFLHLGTLLITALRLSASAISQGQVQTREAYDHGTSHR